MRIGGFGWEWQENRFVQSVSLYQVTYQPLAMQPIGATFMELTQYDHLSPSDQNLKKTHPPTRKTCS